MTSNRQAEVHRKTNETDVKVRLLLDGTGKCNVSSGIAFLDHMLHQLCSHGLLDLEVIATGDTHIDDHHSNEDVGIALGQALSKALGNRKGIFPIHPDAPHVDDNLFGSGPRSFTKYCFATS